MFLTSQKQFKENKFEKILTRQKLFDNIHTPLQNSRVRNSKYYSPV